MRTVLTSILALAAYGSAAQPPSQDPHDPRPGLYETTYGVTGITGVPANQAAELMQRFGGRQTERKCLQARAAVVGGLFYHGCTYTRVADRGNVVDRAGTCPREGESFTDTLEVSGTREAERYVYRFRMYRTTPVPDEPPFVIESYETGHRVGDCPEG